MRVSRLFVDADSAELVRGASLALSEASSHYLSRVLRLSAGAALEVFNGQGSSYNASISEVSKKQVHVQVGDLIEQSEPARLSIHLGIGLSKGDRFDSVIQKATELGVTAITPLITEYCEVRLNQERMEKKQQHWRQVAISACEQSGQNWLPVIKQDQKLEKWLGERDEDLKLVLHPHSQNGLAEQSKPGSLALLIGPEGGFAESEVSLAMSQGFAAWQLGPRILRTETAPVAALGILQYLWGDLA